MPIPSYPELGPGDGAVRGCAIQIWPMDFSWPKITGQLELNPYVEHESKPRYWPQSDADWVLDPTELFL